MSENLLVTSGEKAIDFEGVVNITSLSSFFSNPGDYFQLNLQLNAINEDFEPIDAKFHMGFLTEGDEATEYLTVFVNLSLVNSQTVNVPVTLTVVLYNRDDHQFEQRKSSLFTISDKKLDLGWLHFLETSSFLSDGKNITDSDDTIRVQIKVRLFLQLPAVQEPAEGEEQHSGLCNDLKSLFESGLNSDLTINVGGRELLAHKCILSARSPVFSAMFQHDMVEKSTDRIDIEDVEHDTMREVLRYLYADEFEYSDRMAGSLIAAAEKYDLQALKNTCIENLRRNLGLENCCEALAVGDAYNVPDLRRDAFDFVVKNVDKILGTTEYKEIIYPNQEILDELILALFHRRSETE